jgi:voltage-gated potassium channel
LIDGNQFLEGIQRLGSSSADRLLEIATAKDCLVPTCPNCDVKMVEPVAGPRVKDKGLSAQAGSSKINVLTPARTGGGVPNKRPDPFDCKKSLLSSLRAAHNPIQNHAAITFLWSRSKKLPTKMARRSLLSFVGLAGVAQDERPRARNWGRFFEAPMLFLAVWIIIEWYLTAKGQYPERWTIITNWVIWLFFLVETCLLTSLVRDKRRYLATNWINLLIIAVGVPLIWDNQPYTGALRSLRILLLLGIFLEMSSTIRQMLRANNIGITLLASLVVVVMAGISIAVIDPAIATPWDGIWWAWVTVTTVGYGDIVPESPQGRVFGGLLMVLGLGLFSLMTASFSAFLISREEEKVIEREETFIEKEEEFLEKEEEAISQETEALEKLARIESRLEKLETGLDRLMDKLTDEAPGKKEDPPN